MVASLGGSPTTEPRPVPAAEGPRRMLENVLAAEAQAIADKDAGKVDALLAEHRKQHGPTSEWLAAKSWVARGLLAEQRFDAATAIAEAVYAESEPLVAKRILDQDGHLQTAVGAAIVPPTVSVPFSAPPISGDGPTAIAVSG